MLGCLLVLPGSQEPPPTPWAVVGFACQAVEAGCLAILALSLSLHPRRYFHFLLSHPLRKRVDLQYQPLPRARNLAGLERYICFQLEPPNSPRGMQISATKFLKGLQQREPLQATGVDPNCRPHGGSSPARHDQTSPVPVPTSFGSAPSLPGPLLVDAPQWLVQSAPAAAPAPSDALPPAARRQQPPFVTPEAQAWSEPALLIHRSGGWRVSPQKHSGQEKSCQPLLCGSSQPRHVPAP